MLKERSDLIIRPFFFLNVLQSIVTDDVGAHIPNKKFIVVLKMECLNISIYKTFQAETERVGFEPTVELLPHNLSKIAPSATRTSLLALFILAWIFYASTFCFV